MSRKGQDIHWSPKELAIVARDYPRMPVVAVAAQLPGRSVDAVKHAAKRVRVHGPRKWTEEDDEKLRAGWGRTRSQTLSREIGRSPSALKQRAIKLGLSANRYYTDEEKEL